MAQDEKTIIRSIVDPTISLDIIQLEDIFLGTSDKMPDGQKNKQTGRQMQNIIGTDWPFISINNYVLKVEEIANFIIDSTEFLPKLFLQFNLFTTAAFTTQGMPKDGDLVNVFIRAKNDVFKPIRNDYKITSVEVGKGGAEGLGAQINIMGELFIPMMRDEKVSSYKGTSFEVLKQICKDLNLGFATNETSTDDSQTWICAGDSLLNLMKNIVDHSWKSQKDFYKAYIDVYYHMNFINMNNQFEGGGDLPLSILDGTLAKQFSSNDKNVEKIQQVQIPKMLTNLENFTDTNFFIKQYQVQNNSSMVANLFGYKTHVQFFDLKSMKYWDLYVDPITTTGSEKEKIILKGRTFPKKADSTEKGAPSQEEWWKTQNKKFWLGTQSKNVHDNYLLSEIHNRRNRIELEKMYIEIDLQRWNPNIFNGERIPIVLLNLTDRKKKYVDAVPQDADAPPNAEMPSIDQFYSGYYVTDGMKFTFERSGPAGQFSDSKPGGPDFRQTLTLRRREWPVP